MLYYGIGKGQEEEEDKEHQEENGEEEEEDKKGEEEDKAEDNKKEDPIANIRLPPLIYEKPKRRPRLSKAQLMQMQQLRRWDVRINKITIESLTSTTYDAFLEFVVGGDERVVLKQSKGGEKMVKVGSLGHAVKTEVNANIEYKKNRDFTTNIRYEFFGSYFNILEQNLRIDIWDWEKWGINQYLARVEVPLLELASGNVFQEHIMRQITGKKKKNLCRIRFQCMFQEIWDFYLVLSDWSVSNIEKEKGEEFDPSLKFRLITHNFIKPSLSTKVLKNEQNPQWPEIEGGMSYRGSLHDLENLFLEVTLFNGSLSKKIVGTRTLQLRGLADNGTIKADIVQKGRQTTGHVCFAKGRITISTVPKYRQLGEILHLSSKEQYLCVKVLRVDNLLLPSERGVVNSFITCEWGNQVKTSRTCYDSFKPIYNETFHFPIIINASLKSDRVKRNKAIMNELAQRNFMQFCVWAIDDEGFNDSLGSTIFSLNEMQSGSATEITFYDDDFGNYTFFKVKLKSGKKQLSSPFTMSGQASFIYFEAYLLYEHEADIVFEDIPAWEETEDLLDPDELLKAENNWVSKSQGLRDYFAEEQQRYFKHRESDERNREHFLPFYLCKMSLPDLPSKTLPKSKKRKAPPKPTAAVEEEGYDEEKLKEEKIRYFSTKSLQSISHWVSLIPYSQNSNSDIWTSPEFLMTMGKGDIEEHSLMLACLFLGFKEPSTEIQSTNLKSRLKFLKTAEEDPSKTTLFDKRVFVVCGSLKFSKTNHIWVMTIDDDFKGVTFWETTNNKTYHLEQRVKKPMSLKQFCIDGTIERDLLKVMPVSEIEFNSDDEPQEDMEFEHISDDSAVDEPDEEQLKAKPDEQSVKIDDLGPAFSRMNLRRLGQSERTAEGGEEKKKNFIEQKKKKDMANEAMYSENLHQPRTLENANEIPELPYRTIDIIFNHQNIYMNMQHFDPTKILYDLEDPTLWHPFLEKATNSKPFYSSPSFTPPLNYNIADKLTIKIIKEIKNGISALRSGNNQGTSWKAQSDKVVSKMEQLLILMEQEVRGDMDEEEIRTRHRNWISEVRLLMPEGYRFSAKPAHFNYPEPDRIRNVLLDEGASFFKVTIKQNEAERSKFAIAVKVFPYVGKIISIRILVAVFYPKPIGA